MTQPYKLIKEADTDLESIAQYTFKKWGEQKTVKYFDQIEQCLYGIAKNKFWKQPFPKTHPKLRVIRCEHHYIFYLHNENKIPWIIAILHERMDMLTRIKNRIEVVLV